MDFKTNRGPSEESIQEVEKLVTLLEDIKKLFNKEIDTLINGYRVESITLEDVNLEEELGMIIYDTIQSLTYTDE